METCEKKTIPMVEHAKHMMHQSQYPKDPDRLELPHENFTLPGYVNVTYTCDDGYLIQDSNSSVIGCEYVTSPRNGSGITAKAVWTSAKGIVCKKGETTESQNTYQSQAM